MKKAAIIFVLFILLLINNSSAENSKIYSSKIIVPGLILVKFAEQTGNIESSTIFNQVVQQCEVLNSEQLFPYQKYKSSPKRKIHDLSRIYRFYVAELNDIEKKCAELNTKSGIIYAEPVYLMRTEEIPNDMFYQSQIHLPQIMAPEAWDVAKGDSSIIIAILDTGVDWDHPDLAASIWKNEDEIVDEADSDGNGFVDDIRGWDWVTGVANPAAGEDGDTPDNDPMDFDGHGTHCAGDAAGITNNEIGIASISYNCTIMPLRVGYKASDGSGYIRMDWAAEAFRYAADNGAHVANLSTASVKAVADAAKYAFEAGLVITKSAGNADNENTDPLDVEPFCITVAAVDDRDYKASYSSYGDWVKVAAPGGDMSAGRRGIFSTNFNDTYISWQGTSFAAPITAGLAGLIKSQHPDWSSYEVTFQIINTADNIDHLNSGYVGKLGSGRINAYRAVTEPFVEKPGIVLTSTSIDDASNGNGNGVAEAGEQLSVVVEFQNSWGTAYNTTVNLVINDWAIEVLNASSYLGDIPGLRDYENNKASNSTDPFIINIDSLALPHRVKGVIELIGDNGFSQSFALSFAISPSILLVDDEELDGEKYYFSALDSMNISYDYWNHNVDEAAEILSNYSTVIWSCEWTFPSLNNDDRLLIANYLDSGGNLFLSGQDIGWDLCDQTSQSNQYYYSGGASKTFYENYLHAQYLADNSDLSSLTGAPEDPIGDGLFFNIYQPGRELDEQLPSEVSPLDSAVSIFNYPNEKSGAVRYAGSYRSVYFAFGGYEAIVESDIRFTVMERILNWLNGLHLHHIPLNDTEDIVNDYPVIVNVETNSCAISKVELYWDTDGALPYINKISMTDMGAGLYEASIPAQPADTDVNYTIFAQTESGYNSPINLYSFHVGFDTEPPAFEVHQIPHTIQKTGPYRLSAIVTDNNELNTSSVYLHFKTAAGVEDSLKMLMGLEPNLYGASIQGSYCYGDTIEYYIAAEDLAATPNKSVSDISHLIIGLDDFENGLQQWEADTSGWGIELGDSYSGEYYASDSPGKNYLPGANDSLQLKTELDLSQADSAGLYFWTRYELQPLKTYGYVEISVDSGNSWIQLGNPLTGIRTNWGEKEYSLNDFVGAEYLLLRFRMQADSLSLTSYDGWFIDDVRIIEKKANPVAPNNQANLIPTEFHLSQNYPNPFNSKTVISYQLSVFSNVTLKIYDVLGREMRTLLNENKSAGFHSVVWNAKNDLGESVSSGVYFYNLELANGISYTKKLLLMK